MQRYKQKIYYIILLLIFNLTYAITCRVAQTSLIAVLDTILSESFLHKHQNHLQICDVDIIRRQAFQQDEKEYVNQNNKEQQSTHGERVINEILKMNPQANILYFVVSNDKQKIDENLVIKSLLQIEKINMLNPNSIQYVNLSLGSQGKIQLVQEIIERIIKQFPHLIISAAAGNSGPQKGSIQFPSSLFQVISIGTTNISSSKGPSTQDLQYPIIKPEFVIDLKSIQDESKRQLVDNDNNLDNTLGSSISCAIFTGFVSKQKINRHLKPILMISLINSSYCIENKSIFEQGYGLLDLSQDIKLEQFHSFIYIFPTLIDLKNKNDYWDFTYQLSNYERSEESKTDYSLSINMSVLVLNVYSENIILKNVYLKNKNDFCPYKIFVIDTFLDMKTTQFNMRISILLLHQNQQSDHQLLTCNFIFDFQIRESYTNTILKWSEKIDIQIRGWIDTNRKPSYNILLNQFYQQESFESREFSSNFLQGFYRNQFDYFGESSMTNYNSLKKYFQQKYSNKINFFETHSRYQDIPLLQRTLIAIIDYEKPLSKDDIQYLYAHLEQPNNSLIVFGEWFIEEDNNLNTFNYQTINELLSIYGVQFKQGSFSKQICEINQECTVYYSGCQILIDESQSFQTQKQLSYCKAYFENEHLDNQLEEIVYYLELKTQNDSQIFLFGDSACLEEVFEHKNCYYIIEKLLKQYIQDS